MYLCSGRIKEGNLEFYLVTFIYNMYCVVQTTVTRLCLYIYMFVIYVCMYFCDVYMYTCM